MATKRDLVENLSKKLDYLNLEDAKSAVDCILNYLKDELAKGNRNSKRLLDFRWMPSACA